MYAIRSYYALEEIGLSLGADVPFFVSDYQAVIATGVGEKMREVPSLQDVTVVLVNPGIAVSTKWVFENFVLTGQRKKSIFFSRITSYNVCYTKLLRPITRRATGS